MVQIHLGGTIMRRIMIILLTIVSGSALYSAELVGDFAPLEAGNQWVYQYNKMLSPVNIDPDNEALNSESLTITLTLISSYNTNDTLFHCFKNQLDGIRINRIYDSMPDGTPIWNPVTRFDTIPISLINYDTLREIDSIVPSASFFYGTNVLFSTKKTDNNDWTTPIIPVWSTHTVDLTFEAILGSRVHDGRYEFDWYAGSNLKYYTFRQSVGLLKYYQHNILALPSPSIDITLISFTNVAMNNSVSKSIHASFNVQSRIAPSVKLSLPHLSIENNNIY
jgi:hypothetical protein